MLWYFLSELALLIHTERSYPQLSEELLQRMVDLLTALHQAVNAERSFGGLGSPWEFNLRDLLRWCQLVTSELPARLDQTQRSN